MLYQIVRVVSLGVLWIGVCCCGLTAHSQNLSIKPVMAERSNVLIDPVSQNAKERAIEGEFRSLNLGGEPGTFGFMIALAGAGVLYPVVRKFMTSKALTTSARS